MLGDDFGDPGPVQGQVLGCQRGGDLVDGVSKVAQLDDPVAGGVFARGALGSWGGGQEELLGAGPEVPDRGVQRRRGVAEPLRDLSGGLPVVQVGPQRLVPALGGVGRGREELPSRPHRVLMGLR